MDRLITFISVLSILIFVHEYGHYYLAIKNKVTVEVFSIGFGPEIFGWYDKVGTRWRISLLPLGGYVKMFGESHIPQNKNDNRLTVKAFHYKSVWARAAIIIAGPIANFIFALFVFTILFSVIGNKRALPIIDNIIQNTPAQKAGLMPNDEILEIEGKPIKWFSDISDIISTHAKHPVILTIKRHNTICDIHIIPQAIAVSNNHQFIGKIGITAGFFKNYRETPMNAFRKACISSYMLMYQTIDALGGIIIGHRNSSDLGGPIRIAQVSGKVAQSGLGPLLFFIGYLSISLGLINLMPIPALDGGHLLFYIIEMIRGKPLHSKVQEYSIRIGMSLVLIFMIFTTCNDLKKLGLFTFIKSLIM